MVLYGLAQDGQREAESSRHWKKCRSAYAGRLYDGIRLPAWKARGCHPKIYEVVESFAATLTDQEPKFTPKKRHDEDSLLASVFFEASDYEWERQRMQTVMQVVSRAMLTDGHVFLYTGIDHKNKLFTRPLSVFAFKPDPASENDTDMTYGVVETSMSKAEIEQSFPDVAQQIFDTVTPSASGIQPSQERQPLPGQSFGPSYGSVVDTSGTSRPTEIVSTQDRVIQRHTNRYRIKEFWFTEGGERELRLTLDDNTEEVVQMPGSRGRRIILVEDRYFPELDTDSPFLHGQIPVTSFPCIKLQGEFWGHSYIYPLIDTAEQIADLDNQILNNVKLMLNPAWLVPVESRVDPKKFFGSPAMVIPYRHPFKPEPHIPPALPNYVFELRKLKQIEFDTASGLSDISRGQFSGGLDDVSGKAVALLQKPQYRRMRPIQRSIEEGLPRWGYQTLCNAAMIYDPQLWETLLPADLVPVVPMLPWFQPGYQGDPNEYVPEIKMEAGSNLPPDAEAKASLAMNLYDRAGFGPPGSPPAVLQLLKGTSWPDAEKIATQVGQMMAAMPPQPNTGPPSSQGDKNLGADRGPEGDRAVMNSPEGQEA